MSFTDSFATQNFFRTTLSADISNTATVIPLNAVPTNSEGQIVIDPDGANPEIVYYNSKGASTVTCPSLAGGRGQGGTSARAYTSSTVVRIDTTSEMLSEMANGNWNPGLKQYRRDSLSNVVTSGLTIATSVTLSQTTATGVGYVNGKRANLSTNLAATSSMTKTYTASKDTYVDIKDNGDGTFSFAYVEVANGATSGMTLSTNTDGSAALRIAKVVTSGTAITSVTQSGTDSLGNAIYPRVSYTPGQPVSGYVATYQTTTSTSYTDLATAGATVSTNVGNSGMAMVYLNALLDNSNAGAETFLSFVVSGATTQAAADRYASGYRPATAGQNQSITHAVLLTGLTPGLTTFKMQYKVTAGTGGAQDRTISVIPL
jgi:hypothetical protein